MSEDVAALVEQTDVCANDVELVVDRLKTLRGLLGAKPEVYQQKVLEKSKMVVDNSVTFYGDFKSGRIEQNQLRVLLQFLHNLCVKQPAFCNVLWASYSHAIIDGIYEETHESKTKNILCALVLQLAINDCNFEGEDDQLFQVFDGILKVIQGDAESELEFPLFAVKKLIWTRTQNLEDFVKRTDQEGRWLLFDILFEHRDTLSHNLLHFVTKEFKSRSTVLFMTVKSKESVDPREVTKLLEIICDLSHSDNFQQSLQEDKSLLIDAIYLLRMVHETGKEDAQGMFGIKPKLEDLRDPENMSSDPVYGLKKDLVRLIANLVHQNKGNQDEIREHQGIELLLDCSSADGRNPYITQWVVFAIKNLCHGNMENQEIIQSIEKRGKFDKGLLSEVGVQINQL